MTGKYILLTAAKNEGQYIGQTIESILAQSILPRAWFIVDDGSTDQTAHIIQRFAERNPFIRLLSSGTKGARSFGSKDKAINAAYEAAKGIDFDFIGILDADITFEREDYYESMLKFFSANPRLGIVGGYIHERTKGEWECRKGNSVDSVAGGMQLFRRACYEQMGGYTPMHFGGEDWLAQIDARMNGWEVAAHPEFHVLHYRPTSSAGGKWRGLFRAGMMDASFGSHPIFEMVKCVRRFNAPPVVLGGLMRFAGYAWWRISGRAPLIASQKVAFLRQQQMAKLRRRTAPFALKQPAQKVSV
jgi:biofilm PGA synthesis N-glycosyltransferase PgaC